MATNQVTVQEKEGIPHHLIHFLDPQEIEFNAHKYSLEAIPITARQLVFDPGIHARSPD